MPSIWPTGLPQSLQVNGYAEIAPSLIVRTQVEYGPAKVRRRSSAAPRPIKGSVSLTKAQVAILDSFFVSTLSGGALSFDWKHPLTLAAATFRFVSPPQYSAIEANVISAALDLEILP